MFFGRILSPLCAESYNCPQAIYSYNFQAIYSWNGNEERDKRKPKPQELKFQRLANNNQNVQNGREACEGNDIKPEK